MEQGQQSVAAHFNEVAREYDRWKKKNWYYYDSLYSIARRNASGAKLLLDVGCGTGAMMQVVSPQEGVGIDVSPAMAAIAGHNNANYSQYRFEVADIATYDGAGRFDRILFFDVIEHVSDIPSSIRSLSRALAPGGELVISMANPLWEPILMAAERWGLKMPEGPHHRIWGGELRRLASGAGLTLARREWHLIFPKYIPHVSWFLNKVVGRLPLIRRLSVIEVFVFTKA